jgi:hypothetical protein
MGALDTLDSPLAAGSLNKKFQNLQHLQNLLFSL